MTDEPKRPLTPRLRFPEFRDAGEWEEHTLGKIMTLEYGSPLSEQNRNGGPFPVIGSNGIIGYHDQYTVYGPAIVIGRKGSAGQINWINSNCYPIDTTFYVKNRDPDNYLMSFLKLILDKSDLEKLKDHGAVPGLNRNEIYSIKSLFPKLLEQQKIADCLTSLDDLIAVQAEKLDALKLHKKALMQQLFPAEGETLPRMRFPEFQDAGEWEERDLGQISEIVRGGSPRPIDDFLTTNIDGLNWLKIGDVSPDSKYITQTQQKVIHAALSKTRQVRPGDLILSNSMSFGRPYILKIDSCIHDGWIAITKISNKIDTDYLYYLISSDSCQNYFSKNAAGAVVQNLNSDIIKQLPIVIPTLSEQQKIAECLATLDELIAAQGSKLAALKAHKTGLMQQLFPSAAEVHE